MKYTRHIIVRYLRVKELEVSIQKGEIAPGTSIKKVKLDIMYDELMVKQFDTEAKIKSADASMIRAKVEETMEPLKLDFQKKKMWVDNGTKLISNLIGITGNLVPNVSKLVK